jgi:hypothetical protein
MNMKKVAKSTLALVLASSFTFSSLAFAEENNTNTESFEVVDLQTLSTQLDSPEAEMPALIPGDFFYFSKIVLEKMKLAFTYNNAKEAELLAEYSSERLAEAAALYEEGDEAKALEVIQSAIEYIEQSQTIVDQETTDQEDASTTEEDNETVETGEQAEDTTTTDEVVSEDDDVDTENPYDEIESTLRHNIAALTAAKAHVGNATAEAALQKNIDKTYAKLAKKIDKLEKKYSKKKQKNADQDVVAAEETEETVEPTTIDESSPVVTLETEEQLTEETVTNAVAPVVPDKEKAVNTAGLQKGQSQQKQQANQAKQEVKKANQEAKQAEKEKKNDK